MFERSYDAASFFGHVQDVTGDVWPRIEPTLLAPSATAAFTAAGGDLDASLATWGSSLFRVSFLGLPWQMISPIRPLDFFQKAPGELGFVPGQAIAPEYTTAQFVLKDTPGAPLVHFEIPGHARLSWHRSEYTDLRNAWFCTEPGGCHCPPGMEGSPPPSDPLGSGALLGVTGDPGGNAGNVAAHRLSEFCHPEPRPRPPGGGGTSHGGLGCSTHCGSANGDPHLETFDGYDYDYQAAGEFTAVKSTTDDLEIQERQEPFASLNATVVTAVAMRVAGDRVEIDRGATLGVRLNGARITPGTSPRALPGGGTVARAGDEIVVVWPDGTQLRAWGVGPWGVAYLVDPAAARAGHLAGLLGRFDGDVRHLSGRDGHVYDAASLEGRRGFGVRYDRFGESWRITPAASLFVYARGKTTASYTDRRVPRKIVTAGSLPAHVRIAAERTCRANGIRRPLILKDCVLDVALTKQRTFAASGRTLQHTAGVRHVTTPPPSGGGGPEHFQTTCYSDGKVVPAGSVNQASPGVSAGIVADLEPSLANAHTVIHWTAPPGTIDEPVSEGDTVFADLDTPGMYTVYVSYDGDGSHAATRSATCSWNVAG